MNSAVGEVYVWKISVRMGRVKLKIKKLESTSNRQVTYSKRRNGILKKARELSILCDIDIILLMFSPTGKPTLFRGEQSNIEEVIAKFSQLTPQERAKRKLECLEALKKTFKKLDHDVNIKDYLGTSTRSVEELNSVMKMLHAQLTEVHKRLSCWTSPDKIDNIEHLKQMEDSLRESLDRIQMHKHNLTPQFQNGKQFSLMMGGVQEAQYTILPGEPNFIAQRVVECSSDAPFETFSGYFGDGKTDTGNMRQVDDTGQEGGASNELGSTACLKLEVHEQYPYSQYSNLDFPEGKKYKPEMEMNFQGNHVCYQIDDQFALSMPACESMHHTWVPSSVPCPIAMFNENSYPQQPN